VSDLTLTLDADYATFVSSSNLDTIVGAVQFSIATVLELPMEGVHVDRISAGSVIIEFTVDWQVGKSLISVNQTVAQFEDAVDKGGVAFTIVNAEGVDQVFSAVSLGVIHHEEIIRTTPITILTTETSTTTSSRTSTSTATVADYNCKLDPNCRGAKCDGGTRLCSGCTNSFAVSRLPAGACVTVCPDDTVQFGSGNSDRVCRSRPVECKPKSGDCTCPPHLGIGCRRCSFDRIGTTTCLECKSGPYYLAAGIGCVESITCRGGRFIEISQRRCGCKVAGGDTSHFCAVCKFSNGKFGKRAQKVCTRCTDARYLTPDGQCVKETSCPEETVPAGVGNNGRECRPPFTCKQGVTVSGRDRDSSCTCQGGCRKCSWRKAGYRCLACERGLYELDGECSVKCPTGFSHVGVGR